MRGPHPTNRSGRQVTSPETARLSAKKGKSHANVADAGGLLGCVLLGGYNSGKEARS